ncbi:MAG: GTPase ObgE [Candidatus Auribacterota bacterium]|jgi:GTP-binding protein|uniref:GTPase Obg n=1 Tax=Candidatus Auribacter fodinae TaxID=2093366 RepID=A0A3A4REV4_9BACT|nr:MAG: GTPase ObgE [Candidatus Auribacter fodinae]
MFTDRVTVYLKAGDGGNGCLSFRREKFVPRGGPDGGNGGKGGDIIFQADPNQATLVDFYYKPHIKSNRGQHGKGSNKTGRSGKDVTVKIPVGTQVINLETGIIIHDFVTPAEKVVMAKGGRGGKGNAALATQFNTAPHESEPGVEGEEIALQLELKLIADVGLVGFPNAGKSTLISRISSARPKIADYPFTTLSPVLGTVQYDLYKSFVVADIPGILEGAHDNVGLGHAFLRHIERNKVLVFVLDMSSYEHPDPVHDYRVLEDELRMHKPDLITKPRIVAANKMDVPESAELLENFRKSGIHPEDSIFPISAATGQGIKPFLNALIKCVEDFNRSQ